MDDKRFSPPSHLVRWFCIHVASQVQREVWAQTAFEAARKCGWSLSECTTEQAKYEP
jgi:hypothetical protein